MNEIIKESKEFKLLFKKSSNLLNGIYSSKIKGDGIEFVDLKEYVAGDDVRRIDWKVSAREGKTFVKEFLEDKDASDYVLVDTSLSMNNKLENTKVLAVSLLLSSLKSRDNFSVGFFNKDEIKFFPLSKSRSNLMRYIYEISNLKLSSSGNLKGLLVRLLSELSRKSRISIISDEMEFDDSTKSLLKILNQKHKVLYFQIFSSNEMNLDAGLNSFEDVETGFNSIYDLDEEELEEYKLEFKKQLDLVKSNLFQIGIRPIVVDTDRDIFYQVKQSMEAL